MDDFNKILENIEKELAELRKINVELVNENQFLRAKLGMPERCMRNEILIRDVFNKFHFNGFDRDELKTRALNVLIRGGNFKTVSDLKGKNITDLLSIRNSGPETCAIIVLVLEHYGVQISMETTWNNYKSKVSKVKKCIEEYRLKIVYN